MRLRKTSTVLSLLVAALTLGVLAAAPGSVTPGSAASPPYLQITGPDSPAGNGDPYHRAEFYIVVLEGTPNLTVRVFDADVGAGTWGDDPAGIRGYRTACTYTLYDPAGNAVVFRRRRIAGDRCDGGIRRRVGDLSLHQQPLTGLLEARR